MRLATPSGFEVANSSLTSERSIQAGALGLPDVHRVFVPHPIQDALDDEMRAKADACIDEVIAALVL